MDKGAPDTTMGVCHAYLFRFQTRGWSSHLLGENLGTRIILWTVKMHLDSSMVAKLYATPSLHK
jgi:hypothetical protein